MPNTTPLIRQSAIFRKLKSKPYATFKEIEEYVNQQLENQFYIDDKTKVGFSKRTFERDLKDLDRIFGASISYSKSQRGYFISDEISNQSFDRMIEAFDVLNALKIAQKASPHILLENRKPQGTEHLFGMLHAIQNHVQLQFTHQKYWEDHSTTRTVKPLAVKEYRYRWYLLAQDNKDGLVKTFGLDRISDLKILEQNFKPDPGYNASEQFKDCFGVIATMGEEPAEVLLTFTPFQGKYIKSLPLHHSQKLITDNKKEVKVSLKIYPTHDFIMELLSFGDNLKIIKPDSLIKEIKNSLQKTLKLY